MSRGNYYALVSAEETATSIGQTVARRRFITILTSLLYAACGVFIYYLSSQDFSGKATNTFVDAVYFCTVTLTSVGYGDIVPSTSTTKIFTTILALFGVWVSNNINSYLVSHITKKVEEMLSSIMNYMTGWSHLILDGDNLKQNVKLLIGLLNLVISLVVGVTFFHFYENLSIVDSIYVSVISITTVGYGDKAFDTTLGRTFSIFWILHAFYALSTFLTYLDQDEGIDRENQERFDIVNKVREEVREEINIKEMEIREILTEEVRKEWLNNMKLELSKPKETLTRRHSCP